MTSTLSVVGTPIGNLGDITLRALETLKAADVIVCEDTRVTAKLLARYHIQKPLLSYHARSGQAGLSRVFSLLEEGKHLALVTDAGTPGISDPGGDLIRRVREHMGNAVRIEAIPGASALTAAFSISGVPTSDFLFLGFLPHKKGRQTLFAQIASEDRTVVFYESPHRIEKTLLSLGEVLPSSKRITLCREITKLHEEVVTGTAQDIFSHLTNSSAMRGEFVVLVHAYTPQS